MNWASGVKRGGSLRRAPLRKQSTKKSALRTIKKDLDDVCRKIAHIKWNETCVTCGKSKDGGAVIQWAHLFTATPLSTRWFDRNFALQCSGCNFHHEHDPSHYVAWFVGRYGWEAYEELRTLHHSPKKSTILELAALLEEKKRELETLKATAGLHEDIPF